MNSDKLNVRDATSAAISRADAQGDHMPLKGVFTFECRDKDDNLKWEDTIDNLVTTVGLNDILDKYYAGSAYTAANYMGLISSVSYAAGVVNADTMASHAGWTEAGGANAPAYSGNRPACAWAAASARSKALSAGLAFTFSSPGTLKGSFITTVTTKDGTTGVLISGGTFTGGDRTVAASDVVTASYSISG